jgi:hypothetical protein
MQQDTTPTKQKIIETLKTKGPSLPVHIAKETGLSPLFASAFLGELLSNKEIKISNMKVGSSPVYHLPGQEKELEKYSQHLKSRERDAFELLKQKKFLIDSEQEPAIRVALREIKDFAKHFDSNGKIIWRYFTINIEEYNQPSKAPEKKEIQKEPKENSPQTLKYQTIPSQIQTPRKNPLQKEKQIEPIFRKKQENSLSKTTPENKKVKNKKKSNKKNQKFFNKIKQFVIDKGYEISDIIEFTKSELTLIVKKQEKQEAIIAFNKKRVTEDEIIKCWKKSQELNLPYRIITKGEQTKKLQELIEATKKLSKIEKFA